MLGFCPFKRLTLSILTVLILAWVHSNYSYAQTNKLSFDNFTIENGLSNNYIHSIYQDKKGWMWFGTNEGLNRFDGYKFTVFNNDPSDSTSLQGSSVRAIFEDTDGNLWIGTAIGGLNKFDREKENFIHYTGSYRDFSLKGKSVNVINQDKNGLLWIGTNSGLCQFDPKGQILKLFTHSDRDLNTLVNDFVRAIYIDRTGKLWLGTRTGLDVFDPLTGQFKHIKYSKKITHDDILEIYCDSDSKIWIGTLSEGIFIINPLTYEAEQLIIDPANERSISVRSIVKDITGKYWIGTRGGLYIYSKETKKFNHYEQDEREPNSLCHVSVFNIYKDAKGDFWIGTRGGISYVISEKQVFRHYKALPHDNHYLNNSELYTFWMDPRGKLWIGTEKGGINILDFNTGLFSCIMHNKTNPNSLSQNCVKALMSDKFGNLWVGTFLGGINVIDLKTGQIIHYQHQPNNIRSLSDNNVWTLYNDSKNNIWVGTDTGLDCFDQKTRSFIHYNKVVHDQPVNWIKEDSYQDLWIGAKDEILIYSPSTQKVKRYAEKVRMMHEDSKGGFGLQH